MRKKRLRSGYSERNVVIRRAKDSDFAFLYFSAIFGTTVYLIASAVCKGIFTEALSADVLFYLF